MPAQKTDDAGVNASIWNSFLHLAKILMTCFLCSPCHKIVQSFVFNVLTFISYEEEIKLYMYDSTDN